jgi:nucleotide-binding universal stress UspA family protein
MKTRILVPIDFSPCSDAALEHALALADESGAEVEVLYVWCLREPAQSGSVIFADTPQGIAMERRLSAAESEHAARVSGRLEFGDEPSSVILDILQRERFDMVVMGAEGEGNRSEANAASTESEAPAPMSDGPPSGHVAANVARTAKCKVVTTPPPPLSSTKIVAA